MSDEPSTKLYFVKKPTMSSADYGRKPVIGKMKTVKGRPRKIKEPAGTTRVIEPTATEKLQQQIGRARRRVITRGIKPPMDISPFVEEAKERIRAKTIVGQQQAKLEQEKALAELSRRQAENTAVREAHLALPQLIERQTRAITAIQPELQQNLLALRRVAPDMVGEEPTLRGLFEIEEPSEAEAMASRQAAETEAVLRHIIEEEELTSDKDIVRRFKELKPERKRMPKNYKDIVAEIKRNPNVIRVPAGKGLQFGDTTTVGKGRKGISGGLLDVPSQPLSGNAIDWYLKNRWHNPDPGETHHMIYTLWEDIHPTSFFQIDDILTGRPGWVRIPAPPEGSGLFSDVFKGAKSLAKKGLEKAIDVVKENPLDAAKKAFEFGQLARKKYAETFGKKEKGGKMFIPKKHEKILHRAYIKAHGKGFGDYFFKGLRAPFDVVKHIPVVKDIPILKQAANIIPGALDALGIGSLFDGGTTTTVESAATPSHKVTPKEYTEMYNRMKLPGMMTPEQYANVYGKK